MSTSTTLPLDFCWVYRQCLLHFASLHPNSANSQCCILPIHTLGGTYGFDVYIFIILISTSRVDLFFYNFLFYFILIN